MNYVLHDTNNQVLSYPVNERTLRASFPNSSVPSDLEKFEPPQGERVSVVQETAAPEMDVVWEAYPVLVDDVWEQRWEGRNFTAEEIAQQEAELQARITTEVQRRLDNFAKTRGYDGIQSACTYAASPNATFSAEGTYCLGKRDETWAKMYTILAEVEGGTRPKPSGYEDIEADLPALEWPA